MIEDIIKPVSMVCAKCKMERVYSKSKCFRVHEEESNYYSNYGKQL
jgi:hypothetical protein